jgi:hypothetical protein
MTIENLIGPLNFNEPLAKISDEVSEQHTDFFARIKAQYDTLAPTLRKQAEPIIEKVKEVANPILKAGITAFLYWVNPSLFAIGFIGGIVFDEHVRYAIQKIKNVWKNQELAGCLIGSFACALSLPVSLAAASLLWSAHFGSFMHPSADETTQMPPGA